MSGSLSDLDIGLEYRTGTDDLVRDFYVPCLRASDRYDRAVGYFRSQVFSLAEWAFAEFAKAGGQIRLVCSPDLNQEDIEALYDGTEKRTLIVGRALRREIDRLLDETGLRDRTEVLATLVRVGAMEVRIAFRTSKQGQYHEKIGLFEDDKSRITFKGSSNETWEAWHENGNLESFEVFCSWNGGTDERRTARHHKYFESLWTGEVSGITVKPIPNVAKKRLLSVSEESLDDLKVEGERCPDRNHQVSVDRWSSLPFTPYEHQSEAFQNWLSDGRRGVLKHATGSGKTYTAIMALHDHLQGGGSALVVVPSTILLQQWTEEIEDTLGDVDLLKVGGGHHNWKTSDRLQAFTDPDPNLGRRIVLATLQTARTEQFRGRIREGEHLMLVVDEVHRSGSEVNSNIYELETGSRLGLSATPHRYGDPDGTEKIFDYFGGLSEPVYSLQDAIGAGRLVEYSYHPHVVNLRPDEAQEWDEKTKKIQKEFARRKNTSGKEDSDVEISGHLKHLLIQRARVAKKAKAKLDLAEGILNNFEEGERWLVYCEDTQQLDSLQERLGDQSVLKYHSKMDGGEEETLNWFEEFGGILLSIRCLDEGVDIPRTTHALVLSSSKNPREFIQRRGRVLRTAPDFTGKYSAAIHDALVVPQLNAGEADRTSLVKTELSRALKFAESAMNPAAASQIEQIAADRGIDLEEVEETGVEGAREQGFENDPE